MATAVPMRPRRLGATAMNAPMPSPPSSTADCSAGAQSWLWQVRDPWQGRKHDNAELMLYVVGGDGTLSLDGREMTVAAGSFAVVPRGTDYGFTRRGRNPLILLATLSGPPCAK